MHHKKLTVAIGAASTAEQLPVVLAMAARVLRTAVAINNTPKLILFGTGLSDARPTSIANIARLQRIVEGGWKDETVSVRTVDVVVAANDLAMLRLLPSIEFGELCELPDCVAEMCKIPPTADSFDATSVDAVIDCLMRPPPITGELPVEWLLHMKNVETLQYLRDLWNQSLTDAAQRAKMATTDDESMEHEEPHTPSPFDLLSLAMYCKLVSVAARTTAIAHSVVRAVVSSVPGAKDAGLDDIFPQDGGMPTFLSFLEGYMLGDEYPWQLTQRGTKAAAKSRIVVDRVFAHAKRVASVLKHAQIAASIEDSHSPNVGKLLVIQDGPHGNVAKLLAGKTPTGATATAGKFVLQTATASEWPAIMNDDFKQLVATLTAATEAPMPSSKVAALMAAYTALSSDLLATDQETRDKDATAVLTGLCKSVVSTFPTSVAAHLARELIVRENVLVVDSMIAFAAVQRGTSAACTFTTFCTEMANSLASKPFYVERMTPETLNSQELLESIARALDTPHVPLGVLQGTIGDIVAIDGVDHRVIFWKRGEFDEFVTFLPKEYLDLAFADYATGSRTADTEELAEVVSLPFFVTDSIFSVNASSVIPGSNGLAYHCRSVEKMALFRDEEREIYARYEAQLRLGLRRGVPFDAGAGATAFFVRETANDRLAGLKVAFARSGKMVTLVSANAKYERVSF